MEISCLNCRYEKEGRCTYYGASDNCYDNKYIHWQGRESYYPHDKKIEAINKISEIKRLFE